MSWILIILVVIILIIIIYLISTYNGLINARNRVKNSWSQIDVQLKRRMDLIPNLVETVKGYAKHEKETFEAVISARNKAVNATTMEGKIEAENQMSGVLGRLFALAEAYPELKANVNFLDLQNQLKSVEEDIANARKYFNGVTRQYNTRIQVFPTNIVAGLFNFTKKPLFEVADEAQRQNVKVSF